MNLDFSNHHYHHHEATATTTIRSHSLSSSDAADAPEVLKPDAAKQQQLVEWHGSETSVTASMHGSLTSCFNFSSQSSLNLDSLTVVADLDRYCASVRSLPAASIARDLDAPWNESPLSLQHQQQQQQRHRRVTTAPPAGVSPLDHLQNSISCLTAAMETGGAPPFLIEHHGSAADDDLNDSLASLGLADLGLDNATAHMGNVSRTPVQLHQQQQQHSYNDPLFSHPSISPPHRRSPNDSWEMSRYKSRSFVNHNDCDDPDDEEDDNNGEIIKILRHQISSLNEKLTAEKLFTVQQTKHQLHQQNGGWSAPESSPEDSFSGYGYDSLSSVHMGNGSLSGFVCSYVELSDAEAGIQASTAHLKASMMEHAGNISAADNSSSTHVMIKDKFLLGVIDERIAVMQTHLAAQDTELQQENEQLARRAYENNARIVELERQLKKRKPHQMA